MKREWGILLTAVAISLALCAGCATPPTSTPETPAPPTTAQAGATTIVAVAPPAPACCPKQTLPEFLGIKGLFQGVFRGINGIRNLLGSRFPGLEARPPVLALTDPANSGPDAPPAVSSAAEIKAEEDAAPQKIKALRYLATIGCGGCYPGVEEGFLAALDDCTESVRYEAAKAIRDTIENPCKVCRTTSCCGPELRKKLNQIAHEMDDHGCYKEPSPRVRRLARLALCGCGGATPETSKEKDTKVPTEGPEAEPPADESKAPETTAKDAAAEAIALLTAGRKSATPTVPKEQTIAATVNGELIFAREILPRVEARLAVAKSSEDPEQHLVDRVDALRDELYRAIDRKLVCQDARRRLSPAELATMAHQPPSGSSAVQPASATLAAPDEELLATQWIAKNVPVSTDCTGTELLDHYSANRQNYPTWRRLRWEQASARFDRFPNRQQAIATLDYVRSDPDEHDVPPPDVNLEALEIRTIDWARCSESPSGEILQALATLPLGEISPVIRDETGLHVVLLHERAGPGTKPFEEVAETVRQEVLQTRRDRARQTYLSGLRKSASIWTFLDAPVATASLLSPEPAEAAPSVTTGSILIAPPVSAAKECPCQR